MLIITVFSDPGLFSAASLLTSDPFLYALRLSLCRKLKKKTIGKLMMRGAEKERRIAELRRTDADSTRTFQLGFQTHVIKDEL